MAARRQATCSASSATTSAHDVLRALQRILQAWGIPPPVHEAGGYGQRVVLGAAVLREDEQRERLELGRAPSRRGWRASSDKGLYRSSTRCMTVASSIFARLVGRELALLLDGAQHLVLASLEVAQVRRSRSRSVPHRRCRRWQPLR